LAVPKKDENLAKSALPDALASIGEPFEPETTAHNLRTIRGARERRQKQQPHLAWTKQIEERLDSATASMMSKVRG
jgi:hypothetical protein